MFHLLYYILILHLSNKYEKNGDKNYITKEKESVNLTHNTLLTRITQFYNYVIILMNNKIISLHRSGQNIWLLFPVSFFYKHLNVFFKSCMKQLKLSTEIKN